MAKLWEGRESKKVDSAAEDFNSSIRIDSRMYREDITGSMAHAAMLGAQGIIAQADAEAIIAGLEGILSDIESGELAIDMQSEDIHSFVEMELTSRIGEAGKRLHTARSRNGSFGLGLSIARSIVSEHGGKIWAESNPTGNCFHVLLPCYPAKTGAQ